MKLSPKRFTPGFWTEDLTIQQTTWCDANNVPGRIK